MKCKDCDALFCLKRTDDGGCDWKDVSVILTQGSYADMEPRIEFIPRAEFLIAASELVDAVERYVKQGCLRSELLIKVKKLKTLL